MRRTSISGCACEFIPAKLVSFIARIRRFAHPWRDIPQGYEPKIRSGLEGVRSLNDALSKRAETLGASKAAFTVSLLNMMAPNVGKKGTAVSWHADSCLEHGSTISVFQCVDEKEGGEKKKRKWRLGVRVRRDSEGPGRRDPTEKEITGDDTPRLAVSIPNPGVYHMLDDFNHHHQHCVLAGERGRRISSTHRVARKESHTAQWVLLLSSRKGINKAHALDVIEFEWLRQWYAQGHGHARRLSHYWRAVLDELEKHWFELERAEYVRFRALVDAVDDQTVSARRRKKMRARLESSGLGIAAYDSAIADLEQRLQKRNAWHLRETNSFWESQPEDARPILPLPFLSRSKDGSTLPIDLAGPVLQLKKARSAYVASSS